MNNEELLALIHDDLEKIRNDGHETVALAPLL
jgi:hypothetical protein